MRGNSAQVQSSEEKARTIVCELMLRGEQDSHWRLSLCSRRTGEDSSVHSPPFPHAVLLLLLLLQVDEVAITNRQ